MGFRGVLIIVLLSLMSSCYSLKGITIAPTISTFYIDQFQNAAFNAPPDIAIDFGNDLRTLILNSSRLSYNETAPDIEFSGSVQSFRVTSVAPTNVNDQVGSALNRLQISVQVDFVNNEDDEENWSQSFSFFQDFESSTDLSVVQDALIERIFDQITQDIFNKAFTNW